MQGASVLETVRDITTASHIIGNMSDSALDDPLFDRYKKLGCAISPLEKDSDDYKMITNYMEKTYEPYKVGEIVRDLYPRLLLKSNLPDLNVSYVFLFFPVSRVMVFPLRTSLLLNLVLAPRLMK